MITSKKKFIYLISPNRISKNFYKNLSEVLSTNKVKYFQLRLKRIHRNKIIEIGKKAKKICRKYNVKFIVNDYPDIAKILNSDGCHLGQNDVNIKKASVAIGGINSENYKKLLLHKVDFLAISGYIWNNRNLTPLEAIKLLKNEN